MERSYSELIKIQTYEARYDYLKLGGQAGQETFGYERYLNQRFYQSAEWKEFRRDIIVRDHGCDIGVDNGLHEIVGKIIIHHINPINPRDITYRNLDVLLNPENAICVSHMTHEAIHYGDRSMLIVYHERRPNDTTPWK